MKKKREGQICKLGSEWASKRRPPGVDERGLTALGYKFMSSRPSERKTRLGFHSGINWHANASSKSDPGNRRHSSSKVNIQLQHGVEEEEDEEGDWISQLGAQYMTRKKLHVARAAGPCSAHFPPREHELELDNELDDSWIADFGMQWMRRRRRTRRGQYKAHDDAWLCELGYQWMSRVREREHANQSWLSGLSSLYMIRRKQETDHKDFLQTTRDYRGSFESSPWDTTRRRLHYPDLESELASSKCRGPNCRPQAVELNAVLEAPQPADLSQASNHAEREAKFDNSGSVTQCVDLSPLSPSEKGMDEVDASDEFQVLEFDPLGHLLEPAQYVDLDSSADSF